MNNEYESNDLCLITTLHYMSVPILRINAKNPKKVIFVFENSEALAKILSEYFRSNLLVDPVKFFQTLKIVKSSIYGQQRR